MREKKYWKVFFQGACGLRSDWDGVAFKRDLEEMWLQASLFFFLSLPPSLCLKGNILFSLSFKELSLKFIGSHIQIPASAGAFREGSLYVL